MFCIIYTEGSLIEDLKDIRKLNRCIIKGMMNHDSNKKIVFITRGRSHRGGHVVLTNVVKQLRKEGYDVVLTTFESRDEMKREVPYWNDINANIIEIPFVNERNAEQIEHVKAASAYIRENIDKFDKIILDSWFIALATMRENIFSEKICHLVQSDPAFAPENKMEFWKAELFNLLPLIPTDRIVVSNALANEFQRRYGKKFNNIQLFVDEVYLSNKFAVKNRKTLKIVSSSSTFNISTKGLDFLLDQLEGTKGFNFELTLISGDEIKKDLSKYSFPVRVKHAKNPTEMKEELCKNDIYVNTSTEEAFCLALAEAVALGMPSIALDSIGNREYMNGENAVFVTNPENFIPELLKFKDYEFRKKISILAGESMKKFTLINTTRELKELLKI